MNILLIQLKRIGDLILTTPAITVLRQKHPDAKLTLVVSRECAELLPAIPNIDNQLVADSARCWLEIARGRFDYAIDFTRNDRSAFLVFLSRAKKRIVSFRIKGRSKIRTRIYNEFVEHRMRDMHTVDYHLALVEPLGISSASPAIHLELPATMHEKSDELRKNYKIGNRFVIFHPGSARTEKFWIPERWAEVIDHAGEKHDIDLILTGGMSALEQAHLAEIKSKVQYPIIDLSGKTDLLTLAALIRRAQLLVTVDSAPMHLAAATRTPQVVLFGPTNPFHWRPRESPALILQGTSAARMTQFVPKQPRVPMKQISTQAVIDAMETLLSAPAVQPPL